MQGQWALITGASAGIGAKFAEKLAAQGWSLLLIARRKDKLETVKQQVIAKYDVPCEILVADLSEVDANQKIFQFCEENNITIQMLINNAGYGVTGDFDDKDWKTHQDMLQVMLMSVTELSHLFYPKMKQLKSGNIINVASLAGFVPPTPSHTLYGAVKSYMIKFSHSLHLEAKDHHVHVTAVCPGFTYTEFHDVNGTRNNVNQMSKKLWMSSDEVVDLALQAVHQNQAVLITGWRNRLIANLTKILPDRLMRYLMKGSVSKFRKR